MVLGKTATYWEMKPFLLSSTPYVKPSELRNVNARIKYLNAYIKIVSSGDSFN
jgi:hypothetical protein